MEISSQMYVSFFNTDYHAEITGKFRIAISWNFESDAPDLKDILSEFHGELQLREQFLVNPKDV